MKFVNWVLISYMNKVSEAFLTCEQNHKLKKRYVFAQRELSDMLSKGIYTVLSGEHLLPVERKLRISAMRIAYHQRLMSDSVCTGCLSLN